MTQPLAQAAMTANLAEEMWREQCLELRRELDRADAVADGALATLDGELAGRLRAPLQRLRDRIDRLERRGREAPAGAALWDALDGTRADCRSVYGAELELLGGLALCGRLPGHAAAHMDGGFARRAETWLRELHSLAGLHRPILVLPGGGQLVEAALGVIRAPLVGGDLWQLPLLARALADLAVREDPVRDGLLGRAVAELAPVASYALGDGRSATAHVKALFADMFATALAGPAFAIATFVLELDYAEPMGRDAAGDPAPVHRAAAILGALRRWQAALPRRPWTAPAPVEDVAARLASLWASALPDGGAALLAGVEAERDPLHGFLWEEAVAPQLAAVAEPAQRAWRWAGEVCRAWSAGDVAAPGGGRGLTGVVSALWRYALDVPGADAEPLLLVAGEALARGEERPAPRSAGREMRGADVLERRLLHTARRLEGVADLLRSERVPRRVRTAVTGRLLRLLSERLYEIDRIAAKLAAPAAVADWRAWAEAADGDRAVLREALELLGGAELVRLRLDRDTTAPAPVRAGTCSLGDRLLDGLARRTGLGWAATTVLGPEPLLETSTEVVRVRFPDWSVWNLALLAHEFGHLAARETPALAVLQRRHALDAAASERLEELFADVFATYALGPAFVCDAILLQLMPRDAAAVRGGHPAHAARAAAILRTLALMDAAGRGTPLEGPYAQVLERLESAWAAALRACGGDGEAAADAPVDEVIGLVDRHYRLGARFAPQRWTWATESADAPSGRVAPLAELRATAAEAGLGPLELSDLLSVLWAAHLGGMALGTLSAAADRLAGEYMEADPDD